MVGASRRWGSIVLWELFSVGNFLAFASSPWRTRGWYSLKGDGRDMEMIIGQARRKAGSYSRYLYGVFPCDFTKCSTMRSTLYPMRIDVSENLVRSDSGNREGKCNLNAITGFPRASLTKLTHLAKPNASLTRPTASSIAHCFLFVRLV